MRTSTKRWRYGIGVFLLLGLLLGLSVSGYIVATEGVDGLWERKRKWVEGTQPALAPALDEFESKMPPELRDRLKKPDEQSGQPSKGD